MDLVYSIVVQKTGLANGDILDRLREEMTVLENKAITKNKIKFFSTDNGVHFYDYKNDAKKVRSEIEQSLVSKFPTLGIKLDVREHLALPSQRPF